MNKPFSGVSRVVVNQDGPAELVGRTGTVVRVKMSTGYEAWVEMDDEVPKHLRQFADGDHRERHVCFEASEVDEVVTTEKKPAKPKV